MLYAVPQKSRKIEQVQIGNKEIVLTSEMGKYRIVPVSDSILRVTYTQREEFSKREKPGVLQKDCKAKFWVHQEEATISIKTRKLQLSIKRETAAFSYYRADGNLLLAEREEDSKILEEFQTYTLIEGAKTERVETVDGVKEIVREASRMPGEKLYHTQMHLKFAEDEAIYGLGQQEEGLLNLRGQVVYVHQANRKIAVPVMLSSKGYGILMDTYSPMIFHDDAYGSFLYTEADDEMDYYFIQGQDLNEVVSGYRYLTGKATMLPKWAYGYLQSQERYETADEILKVAKGYRDRGLGLDCLILDWISWEDGKWGQKTFDASRFPDPKQMIEMLHEKDVHFMISIWPTMSDNTENYQEMKKQDCFLQASNIYNALDPKARDLYWKQTKEGLFTHGVDSWWCDSSEPLTVEWTRKERMEPGLMYAEYCRELEQHMPAWTTNAFPYYHALTLYQGQRSETEEKRVCNLTRSAYTGQQRMGTILWSGDTDAKWSTLRTQIASGLNFVATGLPYWTVDIGAFFVKKSNFWYWDGDYQDTVNDSAYLELYTRWYQWGAFLPVFRSHGTDCRREMWYFDGENHMFYQAMVKANRLRYELMPYIYSQAGMVWKEDASMIKMLAFDFSYDKNVLDIKDQYMFGESMMVCPVTEAMYFERGSKPIDRPHHRKVYLPSGWDWYDFWTNQKYSGGQWIDADAPIDQIPLFVKAGSIIPMTEFCDHTREKDPITWRIYPGKNATYKLYQDAGDGYGYEEGNYSVTEYTWDDAQKKLTDATGNEYQNKIVVG